MSNMSYCRFENTLRALRDCYEHMDDKVGEREARYRYQLIDLCRAIEADYAHEIDPQSNEGAGS